MGRENFYLLLELALEPPEESTEAIEKAIDSLRAKWSRFRNHPTKSLQAKQVIGMIPEMRKVMLDPELRKKEARRASQELKRQLKSKYSEVDRHIAIRMSKGFMTDEEVFKLAKLHAMPDVDIRERIRQKEQQKYAEIDKFIAIRMSKGYVTEEEIFKIAKLHSVGTDEVRQRIQGPIRKTSTRSIDQLKALDKTIERVISSNLKIIGKTSLYDFLGLSPGSELELLQERAKQKEAQIHKTSATDAVATASGILAGHCITLFKDEHSRRVYDATLAQSHLKELNSDIDVAGMDGKIRAEYLDVLVDRAVQLGMDDQEAREYIENYCRRKKWTIEKKKRRRSLVPLVAIICLLLAGGGFYVIKIMQRKGLEKDFQNITVQVDRETDLKKKKQLLQSFVEAHKTGDVTEQARQKMAAVQGQIVEQEYQQISRQADALKKEGRLEQAEKIYRQYLAAQPGGPYEGSIKNKIADLGKLKDERAFAEIKSVKPTNVYDQVDRYLNFLEAHSKSTHRNDVTEMIADAREAYYVKLLRDCQGATTTGRTEDLQAALEHMKTFLTVYRDDPRMISLKELQSTLEARVQDQQAFAALKAESQKAGSDLEAAQRVYRDYLLSYPESTVRDEVRAELQQLDIQQEKNRIANLSTLSAEHLASTASRFKVVRQGIVRDKKSGLMWSLLDASDMLGAKKDCLDYKTALDYVKSLNLEGFKDWRLPTPGEVGQLYAAAFPLPFQETRWYWTSKSYTRYADGYSKVVDIVASQPGGRQERQLDSRECASVRAVRP